MFPTGQIWVKRDCQLLSIAVYVFVHTVLTMSGHVSTSILFHHVSIQWFVMDIGDDFTVLGSQVTNIFQICDRVNQISDLCERLYLGYLGTDDLYLDVTDSC